MRSLFEFFNYEQFMKDVATITDTARGKKLTMAQLAMAIMRNYDAAKAPEGFPISQIVNLFKPSSTTSNSDRNDRMQVEKNGRRRLACAVRRGNVVPGPVHLRFSPHRDVRHSVRHAGGRDLVLCLQHRRRLAADHRGDAQDRVAFRMVQRARPPRRLCQRPRGPEHRQDALALSCL